MKLENSNFSRSKYNVLTGITLILTALFIFVTFTIWIIVLKFHDDKTQNPVISFFKYDEFYCLVVPILVPISIIFFYLRWTAFNYFKYC